MSTVLATSHDANGGYSLYPSNSNGAAYLWDGSLVFLAGDGASISLYRVASPGAATPSATSIQSFAVPSASGSSIHNGDLYVADNGSGGSDVWVGYAENGTIGGAYVRHATFDSGGIWTWDTATSCVGNGSGSVNQISVVWTGTYLIVGLRAVVAGADRFAVNYTTTKNGTSGWLSTLETLSGVQGSNTHYFGQLLHDTTLAKTVAIYSMFGDSLQSRVLSDSSSPAAANWGAETSLGVGTNLSESDFQGPAALLDHTTGKVHVAYYDASGSNKSIGYVVGTVGASTCTWGTPITVGTQRTSNDSPSLAVDGNGRVYIVWASGSTGGTSDIYYATSDSPYTSVSAETNVTNASASKNNHPMTPRRARITAGYLPLLYVSGTGSPYNINYSNSISAGTGGSSVTGAASLSVDGNLTSAAVLALHGAVALAADGNLSALAALALHGAAALAADGNLTAAAIRLLVGAALLPADLNLTSAGVTSLVGAASLAADGNLSAYTALLLTAAVALAAQANLSAAGLVSWRDTYTLLSAVIALQVGLLATESVASSPTAVIILKPTPEGTLT
jgi:hypothetical protein